MSEGFGLQRRGVMYNDFVLVGPKADPAAVKGNDIAAALAKLASGKAAFVSRGDKSGTYAAELRYWKAANVDLASAKPAGYQECGCGMGPIASCRVAGRSAVLSERGSLTPPLAPTDGWSAVGSK